MSILWSLFAFVVAISILVAFHEFGHFWVARKLGVKVLRFSIGFGKPLLSYTAKSGTEFVLAIIPLGGYVKMVDSTEAEVATADLPYAFNLKPVWVRMLVVLAGPVFNFLLAFLFYWLIFVVGSTSMAPIVGNVPTDSLMAKAGLMKGDVIVKVNKDMVKSWRDVNILLVEHLGIKQPFTMTVKANGKLKQLTVPTENWTVDPQKPKILQSLGLTPSLPDIPAVVGRVISGSPAANSGLKAGDKIVTLNQVKITDWAQMTKLLQPLAGKVVTLQIERNNKLQTLTTTPQLIEISGKKISRLGIESAKFKLDKKYLTTTKYNAFAASYRALVKTGDMIGLTFKMLYKMVVGQISIQSISGPIGIAEGAGYTAKMGFTYYLDFLALISISLGVINILPIPMLDGGHFLFYTIEVIRGKALSVRTMGLVIQIGLVLIIALMIFAIFNDFSRIFS